MSEESALQMRNRIGHLWAAETSNLGQKDVPASPPLQARPQNVADASQDRDLTVSVAFGMVGSGS